MYEMGDRIVRQFRNKAAALQWLANGRHNRTGGHVEMLYMSTNPRDDGYCDYYWNYAHDMTFDQYKELAPLVERIRKVFRHLREVAPGWQDVPGTRVNWADNSVEVTQRATDGSGRERVVELVAAHGDLC